MRTSDHPSVQFQQAMEDRAQLFGELQGDKFSFWLFIEYLIDSWEAADTEFPEHVKKLRRVYHQRLLVVGTTPDSILAGAFASALDRVLADMEAPIHE